VVVVGLLSERACNLGRGAGSRAVPCAPRVGCAASLHPSLASADASLWLSLSCCSPAARGFFGCIVTSFQFRCGLPVRLRDRGAALLLQCRTRDREVKERRRQPIQSASLRRYSATGRQGPYMIQGDRYESESFSRVPSKFSDFY
jgi:hypothetical protein